MICELCATAGALTGRLARSLVHTSPVRLLLLIGLTIGVTHSLTMYSLNAWHSVLPTWAHSLTESALLVIILFPALYFFSFRPLLVQIAEREQAETIMRESEHKYRHLFNCLGDAAFLVELQSGRVIDVNLQAETLFGCGRAEILGMNYELLFPVGKRKECHRLLLLRHDGDATASFEAEVQTRDGRNVPVHVSAAPLSLFGHDLVITLFRDISEFKTLYVESPHVQRSEERVPSPAG